MSLFVQFIDWISCWRRVPTVQTVHKTGKIAQVFRVLDTVVDMPVVVQRQVLGVTSVQKTVEFPQLKCSDIRWSMSLFTQFIDGYRRPCAMQ